MPTPRPAADTATRRALALSRREALRAAGLLGALATLGGCGLRLERSAPQVPLLPSARPYPGGEALRAELARCRAAQDAASAWSRAGGPALSRGLRDLHAEQVDALEARLAEVHEPVTEVRSSSTAASGATRTAPAPASPTGSPTAPAAGSGDPARTQAVLLAAEQVGLDGAWLAAAPAADRVLLGGCLVARAQAARLLGGPARPVPRRGRMGPATTEQAVQLLRTLYPVLYGLEVATARVVVARAPRAQAARTSLAGVRRQRQLLVQAAGSAVPAPELGYELPGPVSTPAAADALARDLLGDLSDAYVRMLGALGEEPSQRAQDSEPSDGPGDLAAAVASLLGWAVETEAWRGAWGAGPRALPGGRAMSTGS